MVTRDMLERWLDMDLFEECVMGVFVRVNLGQDNYRQTRMLLCQVDSIKRGKEYSLSKKSCDIWLSLKHGSARHFFSIMVISNNPLEEKDFQQ